jgi:hypothetical protein
MNGNIEPQSGKMVVEFDPAYIFGSISLWQQTIDLQLPMTDDFKIHLMRYRRPILEGYVRIAGDWLSALGAMTPVGDATQFEVVQRAARDFAAWAESELELLDGLISES